MSRSKSPKTALRCGPVLGLALLCAPALRAQDVQLAQAPTVTLERVEVSGQRDKPIDLERESAAASRLGLSLRETPAAVEVLDQATLQRRGLRSVTEAAQGAVGVLAGDFPAEPTAFSMRGFANSQINMLYNGIKIGPPNMTARIMGTGNLDRVEILKGPASLMSGEGAIGGAVNLVTRMPHAGAIRNEANLSYGSFGTLRAGVGSGGSTSVDGLDYRFDLNANRSSGFIDDTPSRNWHLSAALDQRLSAALKLWGAVEAKGDRADTYWGTPLVSQASAGGNASNDFVAGTYVSNFNGTDLGTVTIDKRTLKTNYNVLDSRTTADETWLRGGVEWLIDPALIARAQVYRYAADREWFNSEVVAFNATSGLVDRERFFVAHDQTLNGLKAELQWDATIAAMANRLVVAIEWSDLDFSRPGAANFPGDSVSVVSPARGTYGLLTTRLQTSKIRNTALAVENRLRLDPNLALIAGLRRESIALDRTSVTAAGAPQAGFPFSKTFEPTTGRLGLSWQLRQGVTAYGQYATAADVAANNLFLLGGLQPLELTRSRSVEAGVKADFWGGLAQSTFSIYDIQRSNVYSAQGGRALNVAGTLASKGAEWAVAARPDSAWQVWANLAYTRARYEDYVFTGGSFSGNTPPNVARLLANLGGGYRFNAIWPAEIGASVRRVGDRFHNDANTVRLLGYTLLDAQATLQPWPSTKLSLHVRNLTDRDYAAWADPFYPDQILIGAPRSVELTLQMAF
jgi:iron complex outermembrane recepter protein